MTEVRDAGWRISRSMPSSMLNAGPGKNAAATVDAPRPLRARRLPLLAHAGAHLGAGLPRPGHGGGGVSPAQKAAAQAGRAPSGAARRAGDRGGHDGDAGAG